MDLRVYYSNLKFYPYLVLLSNGAFYLVGFQHTDLASCVLPCHFLEGLL